MIKFFIASLLLCSSALAGLPPTSSKISGDSANVTTFNYQFPNLTGTHTGTTVNIPTYSVPAPGSTGSILTSISSAWTSFLVDPITTTIYVDGNRVDSYTPLLLSGTPKTSQSTRQSLASPLFARSGNAGWV